MDLNKLEQETKPESVNCISEKLMNNNVSNLIADDTPPLSSESTNTNEIDQAAKSIENTDLSNIKKTNFKNKKKQPYMGENNLQSYLHDSKFNNSNYTNFATNPINNNYSQPTRTANIQQKKALNLHKLWPHSLKQNQSMNDKTEKEVEAIVNINASPVEKIAENPQAKEVVSDTKTPLCLINELVRFNKIKHEYILLDEIGPAHKKTFFIMLKLGIDSDNEETYTANGSSIKKTQHIAAEIALKNTKFKMPIKRVKLLEEQSANNDFSLLTNTNEANNDSNINKRNKTKNSTTNPPTVKLNTLAMKLGLVANYTHSISSFTDHIDYKHDLATPTVYQQGNNNNKYQQQQQQQLFATQSFDFAHNHTNFMSTEYKPFKYQSGPLYPGNNMPDYLNVYNNKQVNSFMHENFPPTSKQLFAARPAFVYARHPKPYHPMLPHMLPPPLQPPQLPKQMIHVKLDFANKQFNGKGVTLQQAKHDAANQALEYFTNADHFLEAKLLSNSALNKNVKAYRPPQFYQQTKSTQSQDSGSNLSASNETKTTNTEIDRDSSTLPDSNQNQNVEIKSEVQLVHEYAFFLKKSIQFKLIQESGPSHIKKFVTKCWIEDKASSSDEPNPTESNANASDISSLDKGSSSGLETVGEGNSKRLSKKNAAIKMLEILKEKFEPLFQISSKSLSNEEKKNKQQLAEQASKSDSNLQKKNRKNKAKNIIKLKKTSPEYGKGSINPISRLMQIQQAKKEHEPVFELISSSDLINYSKFKHDSDRHRRRQEFVIKCTIETATEVEPLKSEGKGSTKKAAKQKAAEMMLFKLGYQNKTPAQPILKSTIKTDSQISSDTASNEKKVKFLDQDLISEQLNATNTDTNEKIKTSHTKKPPIGTEISKQNAAQTSKQQKIRNIQQAIANSQSNINSNQNIDNQCLSLVFKIAHELLESVKEPRQPPADSASPPDAAYQQEFCSPSAELYLKENDKQLEVDDDLHETPRDLEEKKLQFNFLNGSNSVNYKKMLQYLSNTIGFKVIYQSLLGRDGSVNSYVSLSIMPNTDKPLNGNGLTHIESSNAAALCALQYLASKYCPKL